MLVRGFVQGEFRKSKLRWYEYILAYYDYLKNTLVSLQAYRKTYRNYFSVLMHIMRGRYPVEAVLRGKNKALVVLHNHVEAFFFTLINNREEIDYDLTNDELIFYPIPSIPRADMKLKLYGCMNNGDIFDIFLQNTYRFLRVEGKIVIDIGANIADSSIYFALKGADKVIAIEPFPRNYEMAKKNIEINNLSNKISLHLAGCAAKAKVITVDPNYKSDIFSSIRESKDGIKIPLRTIEDILNENSILSQGQATLKIDCEGCEYEIILSAREIILKRFSDIHIEYHYGYRDLKEKLEECGFSVSVTGPSRNFRRQYIGHIYAKQTYR
jgi:FkbM family methyltransferase